MGSKSRIAKYIVPIIQDRLETYGLNTYIEPFCGGCNVIDKIKCENKIASDNNKYLIALFQNLDKIKALPEYITKEHYSEVRDCFNEGEIYYSDWYVGAIGFLASYNGRFFDGGYGGLTTTKNGAVRNYYKEAKDNLLNQSGGLQDIDFRCCDYKDYSNVIDCVIYCDPPYKNKQQYNTSKNFDYDEFWNWCRMMSERNIVLISEQNAPSDFQCIWEREVKRTIDNNKRVRAVEKLFEIRE